MNNKPMMIIADKKDHAVLRMSEEPRMPITPVKRWLKEDVWIRPDTSLRAHFRMQHS